jgi:hypothetical protein
MDVFFIRSVSDTIFGMFFSPEIACGPQLPYRHLDRLDAEIVGSNAA